jgi:hypothetical protein
MAESASSGDDFDAPRNRGTMAGINQNRSHDVTWLDRFHGAGAGRQTLKAKSI